ncbi:restriction endonuclease subunit S [Mycoplasma sp. P36-A1]|uniref:restriction endonuclease subunit S n=1 Tax=Mycoplasma sp. P36-A1 TaxID=3252900 RepID=UPI003C2D1AF4
MFKLYCNVKNLIIYTVYLTGVSSISNIRPYFKKIWYAENEGGCSNDVLVIRANKDVDSKFLYYVLSDDAFFEYDTATSKGTKMPRGDKSAIMQYQVPDLSIESQREIASTLTALDNRIDENKKINHHLAA